MGTVLVKVAGEFYLNTCCGYCLGQTGRGSVLVNKLICYLSEKGVGRQPAFSCFRRGHCMILHQCGEPSNIVKTKSAE